MKAAIEAIIIKERIRKEITRIPELAADIEKNGLLHPVTVMEHDDNGFRLIAGLRRVKAAESLGWTEIEVNVVTPADAEAVIQIEISENEQRESFTYSERMDYARLIEDIEKAKAKERMLSGKKSSVTDPVPFVAQGQSGRTRDIVAAKINMGKTVYDRAKYIANNATSDVIDQLDKGERSISGVYKELRAKEKAGILPDMESSAQMEPVAESNRQEDTSSKSKTEKPTALSGDVTEEEQMKYFTEKEKEAIRKLNEFNALPPKGKIEELQRQLREQRARAAEAESELALLKENYGISVDHKDSIIESLNRQNAELIEALEAANIRIAELEAGK